MDAPANCPSLSSPSVEPGQTSQQEAERLRALPYEEFLRSVYWEGIRDRLLSAVGRCQICSAREGLRVHHNSYANHGFEHLHPEDLTVLCDRCHMYFHRIQRLGDELPSLYQGASLDNFQVPDIVLPLKTP